MSLPKLSRQPIRPDKEPGAEQEIWFPDWSCFCCHDSGKILSSLVEVIIPDYDRKRDLQVRCQHPRCATGKSYAGDRQYDQRFSPAMCVELEKIERSHWKDYVHDARTALKLKAAIAELSRSKGRSKPRTENNEREIQQRKAEIEAISHEKWIAQGKEYFGESINEFG